MITNIQVKLIAQRSYHLWLCFISMVRIDMFAIYGKGSNPEGAGESSMLLLISHTLSEVPV